VKGDYGRWKRAKLREQGKGGGAEKKNEGNRDTRVYQGNRGRKKGKINLGGKSLHYVAHEGERQIMVFGAQI